MAENEDFITAAEKRLQEIALADDWFQGVTVLKSANGDLLARIEQAIAGLGLFLVVQISGGPAPLVGDVENWDFKILISENPILNRGQSTSGKTARLAVQNIIRRVRQSGCADLTNCFETITEGLIWWTVEGKIPVTVPAS